MENSKQPINPTPYQNQDGTIQHDVYFGLTKREYFAGLAMQGLMASMTEMRANGNSVNIHSGMCENLAIECVDMADALLDALSKSK